MPPKKAASALGSDSKRFKQSTLFGMAPPSARPAAPRIPSAPGPAAAPAPRSPPREARPEPARAAAAGDASAAPSPSAATGLSAPRFVPPLSQRAQPPAERAPEPCRPQPAAAAERDPARAAGRAATPPAPPPAYALNDEQLAVVRAGDGLVLVHAGPGSGKTRTMVGRIVHLLHAHLLHAHGAAAERGPPPPPVLAHEILALTFSKKAASELEARLAAALPAGAPRPSVHTFHSACLALLARNADAAAVHARVPPGFKVASQARQDACLTSALQSSPAFAAECGASAPVGGGALAHVRQLFECARNEAAARDAATAAAAAGGPEAGARLAAALRAAAAGSAGADGDGCGASDGADAFSPSQLAEMERGYRGRLRSEGLLDFDDLLECGAALLRAQPHLAAQYRHVLVDEFQDTSIGQCALVARLAGVHRNVTAVGDPDQSIYGWRFASAANGTALRVLCGYADADHARVATLSLARNYRSTNQIVRAARRILRDDDDGGGGGGGGGGRAASARAADRAAAAEGMGDGCAVAVFECADSAHEACVIAEQLEALLAGGGGGGAPGASGGGAAQAKVRPADIAVLVRVRAAAEAICRACVSRGIPVRGCALPTAGGGGGASLGQRADVRDAAALCLLASGERSERRALGRALALCDGVGGATVKGLLDAKPSGWAAVEAAALGVRAAGASAPRLSARSLLSLKALVATVGAMAKLLAQDADGGRAGPAEPGPFASSARPLASSRSPPMHGGLRAVALRAVSGLAQMRGGGRAADADADADADGTSAEASGSLAAFVAAADEHGATADARARAAGAGPSAPAAAAPPGDGAGDGAAQRLLLRSFLARIGAIDDDEGGGSGGGGGGAVSVLTVHAAKGLEWEVVVVAGVSEGLFPHARACAGAASCAEERRLLYVALTRAKRRLVLTSTQPRSRFLPERLLADTSLFEWHREHKGASRNGAEPGAQDDSDASARPQSALLPHTAGAGGDACADALGHRRAPTVFRTAAEVFEMQGRQQAAGAGAQQAAAARGVARCAPSAAAGGSLLGGGGGGSGYGAFSGGGGFCSAASMLAQQQRQPAPAQGDAAGPSAAGKAGAMPTAAITCFSRRPFGSTPGGMNRLP